MPACQSPLRLSLARLWRRSGRKKSFASLVRTRLDPSAADSPSPFLFRICEKSHRFLFSISLLGDIPSDTAKEEVSEKGEEKVGQGGWMAESAVNYDLQNSTTPLLPGERGRQEPLILLGIFRRNERVPSPPPPQLPKPSLPHPEPVMEEKKGAASSAEKRKGGRGRKRSKSPRKSPPLPFRYSNPASNSRLDLPEEFGGGEAGCCAREMKDAKGTRKRFFPSSPPEVYYISESAGNRIRQPLYMGFSIRVAAAANFSVFVSGARERSQPTTTLNRVVLLLGNILSVSGGALALQSGKEAPRRGSEKTGGR